MLEQWYGILPNLILYNDSLSDKQKLLFVCISSLCAEKWYCFAGNDWFIQKWFAKNWETITRNLKWIESLWFIKIEYEMCWNIVSKRIITIDSKVNEPLIIKSTAIDSKVNDNNTSINITRIKKENNTKEFVEFISNNKSSTLAKLSYRFLKLWWKPNDSVEDFKEWLNLIADRLWTTDTIMELESFKWYTYFEWKPPKNHKSSFLNWVTKSVWQKSK